MGQMGDVMCAGSLKEVLIIKKSHYMRNEISGLGSRLVACRGSGFLRGSNLGDLSLQMNLTEG